MFEITYWPCNVLLNEGTPPVFTVVNRAPAAAEAAVDCIAPVPLP